jgi:hypothetical protein
MASWGEIAALIQQMRGASSDIASAHNAEAQRHFSEKMFDRQAEEADRQNMQNMLIDFGMEASKPRFEYLGEQWAADKGIQPFSGGWLSRD